MIASPVQALFVTFRWMRQTPGIWRRCYRPEAGDQFPTLVASVISTLLHNLKTFTPAHK